MLLQNSFDSCGELLRLFAWRHERFGKFFYVQHLKCEKIILGKIFLIWMQWEICKKEPSFCLHWSKRKISKPDKDELARQYRKWEIKEIFEGTKVCEVRRDFEFFRISGFMVSIMIFSFRQEFAYFLRFACRYWKDLRIEYMEISKGFCSKKTE